MTWQWSDKWMSWRRRSRNSTSTSHASTQTTISSVTKFTLCAPSDASLKRFATIARDYSYCTSACQCNFANLIVINIQVHESKVKVLEEDLLALRQKLLDRENEISKLRISSVQVWFSISVSYIPVWKSIVENVHILTITID